MQQRTVRNFSEDDHYYSALYRYAQELAIKFRDFTSFISTDDKNKVKCGETGCLISAVTRGKRVRVAKTVETADHDFSSITLMPTVVIIHKLPPTIDDSWYCGQPYIYVKMTATEPSSVLRNAVEIEQILTQQYREKEGGPKHQTNLMSVKLAIIALH